MRYRIPNGKVLGRSPTRARVTRLLAHVSQKLGLPLVEYAPYPAPYAAHYAPIANTVSIGDAMASQLNDFELGCVLAHELGHALRRGPLRRRSAVQAALVVLACVAGTAWFFYQDFWGLLTVPLYFGVAFLYQNLASFQEERFADVHGVRYAGSASAYRAVLLKAVELQKAELDHWELKTRLRLLS